MSRFSRAYDGALKTAGLTQAEAAGIAGYHASLVSRVLGGDSTLTSEHVEKLLMAISDVSDREHCLSEFLFDCCPADYRDKLAVSFGVIREARAKGQDDLTGALQTLEKLAVDNDALADLLKVLVKLLTPKPSRVEERQAPYFTDGPASADAAEKRRLAALLAASERNTPQIPRAKKRAGQAKGGVKPS